MKQRQKNGPAIAARQLAAILTQCRDAGVPCPEDDALARRMRVQLPRVIEAWHYLEGLAVVSRAVFDDGTRAVIFHPERASAPEWQQ